MINSKGKIYLIIIFLAMILIATIIYTNQNKNKTKENTIINQEPKLVENYSDFFTVNSCVNKFISYLSANKSGDVLNIIEENYRNNNSINTSNINNYVGRLDGNYSFSAKKMYYENTDNKNIKKYYVYGQLKEETINSVVSKSDYYIIVNLDLDTNIYSIIPYDGSIFKGVEQ